MISTREKFISSRAGMIGLSTLFVIVFMAIVGPSLSGQTYYDTHLALKNQPPSLQFWFGTDDLGRDVFTRAWYGARISLFVGVAAALIDAVVGMLWGGIAAFSGGKVDEIMMRIADILYALPYMLVVILIMVVLGNGIGSILVAMTIVGWISMARVIRGQILQIKQEEYVLASIALGANFFHILIKHLLPSATGSIIVTLTFTIPAAIFVEAFLSFLGLGIQAPVASWGTMVNHGLPALNYYPWRLFFPALLISATMLSCNMIGDALRDATDSRS